GLLRRAPILHSPFAASGPAPPGSVPDRAGLSGCGDAPRPADGVSTPRAQARTERCAGASAAGLSAAPAGGIDPVCRPDLPVAVRPDPLHRDAGCAPVQADELVDDGRRPAVLVAGAGHPAQAAGAAVAGHAHSGGTGGDP